MPLISTDDALLWVQRLAGIAVVLQSVEMLRLRGVLSANGPWCWRVVKKDFEILPSFVGGVLRAIFDQPGFTYLTFTNLVSALVLLVSKNPHPAFVVVCALVTILTAMRWRGVFNGGSDSMTLILLIGLGIARLLPDHPIATPLALWYIALHACFSYFMAGVAKLKKSEWREGTALGRFMKAYEFPQLKPGLTRMSSWAVLVFELGFPLAFISGGFAITAIVIAVFFHLANVYVFGLNRFFFAWIAAYPALYYCGTHSLAQLFQ